MPKRRRQRAVNNHVSVPSSPELGPRFGLTRIKPAVTISNQHDTTSEHASVSDMEQDESSTDESDASITATPLLSATKLYGDKSIQPLLGGMPAPPIGGRPAEVLKAKPTASPNHLTTMLEASSSTRAIVGQFFPSRATSPSPGPASRRRAPSPQPLSLDVSMATSINSGADSPRTFTMIQPAGGPRFRLDVLSEVAILSIAMSLACWRIASLPISNIFPPAAPLIVITVLMPFMTLFRRSSPSTHLMVPFTDERGYRDRSAADDGFPAAVALPILLASGAVWDSFVASQQGDYLLLPGIAIFPDIWAARNVSLPSVAPLLLTKNDLMDTLLDSRICLLVLTTINIFILIFHLILARTALRVNWLPLSNTKRFLGAFALAASLSMFAGGVARLCAKYGHASPYVDPLELTISSYVFQISLYLVSRLARRGFTLGELTIATAAGVSLALEFWRLARARWLYSVSPALPRTFRSPTPLVAYQHTLIPGVFLLGFILSPLLVVSRQLASKPSRRLKWPAEREHNRRLLALGVLVGLFGVVVGLYGGWLAYVFNGSLRVPWSWALRFIVYGGDGVKGMYGEFSGWKRWKRFVVSCYWLITAILAVGGWQTRLVRARRIKMAVNASGERSGVEAVREEKKTLASLDYRRKFFHALAVLLFVPGIAFTPALTSLAFSVAFALFTFMEYARYFALYPIGAPIHVFFNEFIDRKDSGPVILSHFYLLTGAAGGLWLEGKGIKRYSGVLALGIGDAMASIVGRRVGGPKWPATKKTLAGTLAFVLSIYLAARILVLAGLCDAFEPSRFLLSLVLTALLEATSTQNDNLIIPIFFWSTQALLEV